MVCDDLKKIYSYIIRDKVDIGKYDLIRLVCANCKIKDKCPSFYV